jgi:hypothetical protein
MMCLVAPASRGSVISPSGDTPGTTPTERATDYRSRNVASTKFPRDADHFCLCAAGRIARDVYDSPGAKMRTQENMGNPRLPPFRVAFYMATLRRR